MHPTLELFAQVGVTILWFIVGRWLFTWAHRKGDQWKKQAGDYIATFPGPGKGHHPKDGATKGFILEETWDQVWTLQTVVYGIIAIGWCAIGIWYKT